MSGGVGAVGDLGRGLRVGALVPDEKGRGRGPLLTAAPAAHAAHAADDISPALWGAEGGWRWWHVGH